MDDFKVPILPAAKTETPPEVSNKTDVTTSSEKSIPVPATKQEPQLQQINKPPAKSPSAQNSPYVVPPWSAPPPVEQEYKFEVLKGGQIIEEIKDLQQQANWNFGRLPTNDIEMAHPTISRFHSVLQYRPKAQSDADDSEEEQKQQPPEGWYIYDLGSTHGTFLNKQRIPAGVFIRIRVGHMLKLGASTRAYILQGPLEDEEPESELTVTELREQRKQQAAEAVIEAKRKAEEAVERDKNEGISWGMTDDADEETDLTHNPYASTNNEELFLDDPKRTLRGYFEREGLSLEYKCDEMSAGSFVCRVELPIDDANGRPLVAEVVHKGRKKECVVQCALEACRILDRHGVLRQANQEPLKRKLKSHNSDSDDDEFLDRTGDVARKKQRKANVGTSVTLTYEDLLKQEVELAAELLKVEENIVKYQEIQKRCKATKAQTEDVDDLDSFMENLNDDDAKLDKTEIRKLRLEQQRIKAEQQKVQRLIKITKPAELVFTQNFEDAIANSSKNKSDPSKRQLPMIGKRNQFSKLKVLKLPPTKQTQSRKAFASDEEEIDEDDTNGKIIEEKLEAKKPIDEITTKVQENTATDIIQNEIKVDIQNETQISCEEPSSPHESQKVTKKDVAAIKQSPECLEKSEEKANLNDDSAETTTESCQLSQKTIEENAAKKRRQRQRQRHNNKRQDIDIEELDEHESSEKYAKWIPPENQTGDGYTPLNDKYGY